MENGIDSQFKMPAWQACCQDSATTKGGLRILVTGLPSDPHIWNLLFLQSYLQNLGHDVVNLGPCQRGDLLVRDCLEHARDLIVVGTVHGNGYDDGIPIIRLLRGCEQLSKTPIIIGGQLGKGGVDESRRRELLRAGFDAAFDDGISLTAFQAFLHSLQFHARGPAQAFRWPRRLRS